MARNTVDTAASNAMIKQLTAQLAKVQGLNDMVILPSGSQNGNYFVSATVDATQATGLNSSWMNADVNAFFRGVYNAGEPIDMAELTFASGTQIIASAGLGKLAYENMETSTLSGDIASALKVRNVTDNGDSLRAAWFQISRP